MLFSRLYHTLFVLLYLYTLRSLAFPFAPQLDAYNDVFDNPSGPSSCKQKGPLPMPSGAELTSIDMGSNASLAAYWTADEKKDKVTHTIVVIHGARRDADVYWSTINDALQARYGSGNSNVTVVAPIFFSAKLNKKQYTSRQLAWGEVNSWQPGEGSIHPSGVRISSYKAIEILFNHLADKKVYPNMRNVTLVGHSGGAQLVSRVATVVPTLPDLYFRFVVADPSSNPYFTPDRPVVDGAQDPKECSLFNSWRYGFENFTVPEYKKREPLEHFLSYVKRDVVHLNGALDTVANGDQECMAILQGGPLRIVRNLVWWKYLNLLAGTTSKLDLFPGKFSHLPDWSEAAQGEIRSRLSVIPDMEHDNTILSSPQGQSTIFDDDNITTGWLPDKKNAACLRDSLKTDASSGKDSCLNSATSIRSNVAVVAAIVAGIIAFIIM